MIIEYLDKEINKFYQKTGNYPTKIIMNLEAEKKLNKDLEEINISNSWKDIGIKNYKGILIEIGTEGGIILC